MLLERKIELVNEWGFYQAANENDLMKRDIFAAQGVEERWNPEEPDLIRFYRDGQNFENYQIDWALFN